MTDYTFNNPTLLKTYKIIKSKDFMSMYLFGCLCFFVGLFAGYKQFG